MKQDFYFHWSASIVLGLLVSLTTGTQGQSLAQIAAAIARQRSGNEEPSAPKAAPKVYTNKDLKPADPTPAQSRPAPEAVPLKVAAAATQLSASTKDEQWWKSQMRELDAKLRDDLAAVAHTRIYLNELRNRRPEDNSRAYSTEVLRARGELVRLETNADNTLRAVEQFREDARRAGVPPGWLRWP